VSSYIKRLRNGITALRECDALPQGRGLGRSEFERACQILVQRLYGDADQEDWELPESLAGHIVNNLALCHDIAKAIDAIDAKAAGIDLVMLKMDDDDLTALGAALLGKKAEQEGGIRARLPISEQDCLLREEAAYQQGLRSAGEQYFSSGAWLTDHLALNKDEASKLVDKLGYRAFSDELENLVRNLLKRH